MDEFSNVWALLCVTAAALAIWFATWITAVSGLGLVSLLLMPFTLYASLVWARAVQDSDAGSVLVALAVVLAAASYL